MTQGQRFTAWFTDTERERIETEAALVGVSLNTIVRWAVREHFGMKTPGLDQIQRTPEVTLTTRNSE